MKSDATKLVTFRLGEDLFAADIFAVERVLRYQTPTSVPDMPAWVQGVVEYQKRVVPVVSLRRRFELADVPVRPETRILVLNADGEWIGAVVDAVIEVSGVQQEQISPPPPFFRGLAGEFLKGIVRTEEKLVIVLDVGRLLAETGRLVLERAAAESATRG
jgi:purine-binding chemotaxis protein CheW